MSEDFKVRVGEFEGPLDLLLDLIEKRKLHISDVTLAKVADDFIEFTKSIEEDADKKQKVSDLADFILVASTLLLIKSKSLLPALQLTEEEVVSIEGLEERLHAYKKYKELSLKLSRLLGKQLYFAQERPIRFKNVVFHPTPDVTIESLKNALIETIKNAPKKIAELPRLTVEKVISLEEMIGNLSERIRISIKTSFSDFAKASPDKKSFSSMEKADRVNVIVSFLAMLELVKRGAVRVSQHKNFDDIQMESENAGVPTYY